MHQDSQYLWTFSFVNDSQYTVVLLIWSQSTSDQRNCQQIYFSISIIINILIVWIICMYIVCM